MRARLEQIKRQASELRAKLGAYRLRRLPDQLRAFAITGDVPEDRLAAAYLTLTTAATAAMNSSIGGQDNEERCEAYERALAAWKQELRRQGL